MKKIGIFTALMLLGGFLSSCNEEVAQELIDQKAGSKYEEPEPPKKLGKISLVHTMDKSLSFYMHKAGTINEPCEIVAPDEDGFKAENYFKNPLDGDPSKPQVIDCILEAQENDLYQQGASYALHVDSQLCEYVRYRPFKFVEAQYGNTAKKIYEVKCADDSCNQSMCGRFFEYYDGSPGISGLQGAPLSESQMQCEFDYSSKWDPSRDYGRNCDEGTITTVTLTLDNERVDDDGNPETPPICPDSPVFTHAAESVRNCGGNHFNCMGGPAAEQLDDPGATYRTYSNTELGEFVQEWQISAPESRVNGTGKAMAYNNMYLANFSRICSDTSTPKDDTNLFAYLGLSLKGYELQKYMEAPTIPQEAKPFDYYDAYGEMDFTAFARNPWMAFHVTNPYYAFECLDQAQDVKAQIRLFIRDWDRTYTGPYEAFAQVSDLHLGAYSRIDNKEEHQNTWWNNVSDWDDWFLQSNMWAGNQCGITNNAYDYDSRPLYTPPQNIPSYPGPEYDQNGSIFPGAL